MVHTHGENLSNLVLEYSYNLPVLETMIRPTSASHKIPNSFAFFKSPFLRLEKVTCLLVVLSILLITIFPLPILTFQTRVSAIIILLPTFELHNNKWKTHLLNT